MKHSVLFKKNLHSFFCGFSASLILQYPWNSWGQCGALRPNHRQCEAWIKMSPFGVNECLNVASSSRTDTLKSPPSPPCLMVCMRYLGLWTAPSRWCVPLGMEIKVQSWMFDQHSIFQASTNFIEIPVFMRSSRDLAWCCRHIRISLLLHDPSEVGASNTQACPLPKELANQTEGGKSLKETAAKTEVEIRVL